MNKKYKSYRNKESYRIEGIINGTHSFIGASPMRGSEIDKFMSKLGITNYKYKFISLLPTRNDRGQHNRIAKKHLKLKHLLILECFNLTWEIEECEDDWFMVEITGMNLLKYPNRYFRCDQFDGVLEIINDYNGI